MKRIENLLIGMVLFSTIILVGCEQKKSQAAEAFLISPCQLPCWHNITPGITLPDEIMPILREIPNVKTDSIQKNIQQSTISFKFEDGRSEGKIYYIYVDHYVKIINLVNNLNLRLDEIIQVYGEPAEVMILGEGADTIYTYIYLLYPEKGLLLKFKTSSDKEKQFIRPETIIDELSIMDNLRGYIDDRFDIWGITYEEMKQEGNYYSWNGYKW